MINNEDEIEVDQESDENESESDVNESDEESDENGSDEESDKNDNDEDGIADNNIKTNENKKYSPWFGGKPAGSLTLNKYKKGYSLLFISQNYYLFTSFTILQYKTLEKAYEAGLKAQKEISDNKGLTKNKFRIILDKNDEIYFKNDYFSQNLMKLS